MLSAKYCQFDVIKRNGARVIFNPEKIRTALIKAFTAEYGSLPDELQELIEAISHAVIDQASRCHESSGYLHIEMIQDIVEQAIMGAEQHSVAKRYILYREDRKRARLLKETTSSAPLQIRLPDGSSQPLDVSSLRRKLIKAGEGLSGCSVEQTLEEAIRHLYDGATLEEVNKALILAARAKIEQEPNYSKFTARLLLQGIYKEVLGHEFLPVASFYQKGFIENVKRGVNHRRLTPELLHYDLEFLAANLMPQRDEAFQYIGLHLLYDRYLLQVDQQRIETPQYFWMRIAMGLALNESNKTERVLEFYHTLSQMLFVCSTPTLFNSGTCHPQLSSCFISTTHDDLDHIFKVIADNARMSKWAGGLGNDWTNVRAAGALIRGTNGHTQGIVPFLKVANDTAVAVNQGGKRKGVICAYLETWHLDIEDFLELRKNTGDDRRRTHDMNTANWIPDLFMKRVRDRQSWTLFNPCEVADLHDLFGKEFEQRYEEYEKKAAEGKIKQFKTVPALELWRKMITMLFETGHPWITFKDPCNIRSPQKHAGIIHSSNLCTEITLNNSTEETAVCNLGSLNLAAHFNAEGLLDEIKLKQTIQTAMRMLDNVIDINFYPTVENRTANLRHRPVGLGLMAFQDALNIKKIAYDSQLAIDFADHLMEFIAYHAILASVELAKERGAYETFQGSLWSQGVLPIDSIRLLEEERGEKLDMDCTCKLDWNLVREAIRQHGMRNSNTLAIAPTATIAHIAGVSPSIEPSYSHLYSRSNLSGEFTALNPYLIQELKRHALWDEEMLEELKYYDGSIQLIQRIPSEVKSLFKTAFELDPKALIACASRRQKWIDMSQSLNLYVSAPSGKMLSDLYFYAWKMGLKTTYYLRTLAATQVEKSTIDVNKKGIQPRWMKSRSASSNIQISRACSLNEAECESCQ